MQTRSLIMIIGVILAVINFTCYFLSLTDDEAKDWKITQFFSYSAYFCIAVVLVCVLAGLTK